MSDVNTTATTVDAVRRELIIETVQREIRAQAKMYPLVTDVSEFAIPGIKSIEFPKLGSFTVTERADGAKVDALALSYATDKLDLNKNLSVQWILEQKAKVQSAVALEIANAQRAASAHGLYVDKLILQALYAGADSANDVDYNGAAIEDNILDIVKTMDERHVPSEGRFVVFRPQEKKLILGIENFVQADRYGSPQTILSGELGMAYGLRFVMSSNTSTDFLDGVMVGFHKESLAIGFQIDPFYDQQGAIEYGAGAKRYALDQLLGLKTMQGGYSIVRVKAP